MPERAMIFVDAPNLERSIKENYFGFFPDYAKLFAKLSAGYDLVAIYWFDTQMVKEVNPEKYHQQQKFWHALKKSNPKLTLYPLPLRRAHQAGKEWKEEGVDQLLSMYLSAESARYDVAILLTCDADQDMVIRTLQGDPWRKKFLVGALDTAAGFKVRRSADMVVEMTAAWLEDCWRRRPVAGVAAGPVKKA